MDGIGKLVGGLGFGTGGVVVLDGLKPTFSPISLFPGPPGRMFFFLSFCVLFYFYFASFFFF